MYSPSVRICILPSSIWTHTSTLQAYVAPWECTCTVYYTVYSIFPTVYFDRERSTITEEAMLLFTTPMVTLEVHVAPCTVPQECNNQLLGL